MNETDSSQEKGKGEALICPLLALRPQTLDDSVRRLVQATDPNACLREKCGWWDEEAGQCAVMTICMAVKSQ